jgi:hypothetical protein
MSRKATIAFFKYYLVVSTNGKSLVHITNKHLRIIQNAIYNIFFNSEVQLSDKLTQYFKRHSTKLRLLGSKQGDLDRKRESIQKNRMLIRKIATVALSYLKT